MSYSYNYCNSYDSTYTQWTKTGASPYLDAVDNPTNIISTTGIDMWDGYYGFPATNGVAFIEVYCKKTGTSAASIDVYDSAKVYIGNIAPTTSYNWHGLIKLDDKKVYFIANNIPVTGLYIDCARLGYIPPAPTTAQPIGDGLTFAQMKKIINDMVTKFNLSHLKGGEK